METTSASAEAFAAEAGVVPVVESAGSETLVADAPTPKNSSKFYTEDDLAKVRSQEKEKLYPQIEKLKEELDSLKKDREAEALRVAEEEAKKATLEQEALEADMDVRQLLQKKEADWQEQLERERQERERAFALLERERNFADLQSYRQNRLDEERETIIPELLDLVSGNTKEEVDSSIEGLKERSARILESAQSAMQNARKEMTGTRITSPSAGPLETNSEQRTLTAEEISAMPMNEYAKYRQRLLSPQAQGRSKGLFG
jgi:hypothetical protein